MSTLKIKEGKKILSQSSLIICGIVRDCDRNLKKNIPIINKLCSLSKNYKIIIFENDSKDNTKQILKKWEINTENIYIESKNFNAENTIPLKTKNTSISPFYSKKRIEKMVFYRNQYLNYIEQHNLFSDFVIVVDLDVSRINLNGILDSFGQEREWDVISANGYSLSPKLTKRYHDSYALIESGMEKKPQTVQQITNNQYKYSFLKPGLPLIQVYSGFGGLCIYKFNALKNIKYELMQNDDKVVEVYCEHVGLHSQMHENGFNKFFINPNMTILYQNITCKFLFDNLLKRISLYKRQLNKIRKSITLNKHKMQKC